MKINENLKKEENKKRFRELVMKYHPDKGGDTSIMAKINNAKNSDNEFEILYNELLGKPIKKINKKEKLSKMKQWIYDPEFMDMVNSYRGICELQIGEDPEKFIEVIITGTTKDKKIKKVKHNIYDTITYKELFNLVEKNLQDIQG